MQAIIDIGSNSVRLMLWEGGKSLYKRVNTTRLGEGLALTGRLKEAAIVRTAEAVKRYAEEGRAAGAQVHAFATAAVRSAENGADFCAEVKKICNLKVDVVSGGEEALLGLSGALGGNEEGGILDIGGASTEVCLRKEGKIFFSVSLPVGAVRLYDKCGEDGKKLLSEICTAVSPLEGVRPVGNMYAIGGTGSTLASVLLGLEEYDGEKIQDFYMREAQISALADRLLSLSAEERKKIKGMDERRADIIAGGAVLLSEIMKKLSLGGVYASDRDNLEGYCYLRGLK